MLFVCDQCHCVDSIDLAQLNIETGRLKKEDWVCTACQGKEWHHQFPRKPYDPSIDYTVNRPSNRGFEPS